jgi:hypothetical protein
VIRRGVWLVSGAALGAVYPCRCFERGDRWACDNGRCPCWGRVDVPNVAVGAACCCWNWPGLAGALLAKSSAA